MTRMLQIVGWSLLVVAAVHSFQHFFSEFEGDLADPIWDVLDVVMAIALAVCVAASIRRFVRARESDDVVEKVFANFLPLLVIITSVLFVEQVFTTDLFAASDYKITPERLALWEAVDILYILATAWIGVHLVRSASNSQDEHRITDLGTN